MTVISVQMITKISITLQAVDKDKSGFISVIEFKLFYKCLGLTEETAAISFALIDKNGVRLIYN